MYQRCVFHSNDKVASHNLVATALADYDLRWQRGATRHCALSDERHLTHRGGLLATTNDDSRVIGACMVSCRFSKKTFQFDVCITRNTPPATSTSPTVERSHRLSMDETTPPRKRCRSGPAVAWLGNTKPRLTLHAGHAAYREIRVLRVEGGAVLPAFQWRSQVRAIELEGPGMVRATEEFPSVAAAVRQRLGTLCGLITRTPSCRWREP